MNVYIYIICPYIISVHNIFQIYIKLCEILNNSIYDHLHGGGDFSYVYVIMQKYFGKI
jgi:hypothetical protein